MLLQAATKDARTTVMSLRGITQVCPAS